MKKIILMDTNLKAANNIKKLINDNFNDIYFEVYNDTEQCLRRITKNNFDILITPIDLQSEINGLHLARLSFANGKGVILLKSNKLFTKIKDLCYLYLFDTILLNNKMIKIIDKKNIVQSLKELNNIKFLSLTKIYYKILFN